MSAAADNPLEQPASLRELVRIIVVKAASLLERMAQQMLLHRPVKKPRGARR